ncbi:MAG: Asp-tRNA(Asn)/Glu-tRNA(Gln) amidotransferase subunit GatC [Actinomycetia bacterium]|nr:Asp-tRNA(Asn)/Glu-tRNA(Gln) amidotransferase subunit GatC [Actinomycetes bacterium]
MFQSEGWQLALTRDDARHVALLARLGVSEPELEALARELSQVLEHVAVLDELDTEDVPPTFHVMPPKDPWRADVEQPGLAPDQVWMNAPDARDGQFRVPRIVGEAP